MNKNEFLNILRSQLTNIDEHSVRDIMFDYEEHFRIGLEQGRSEEDIAQTLGNPRIIAKQIKAEYMVGRAEETTTSSNLFRAVLSTVALGFFNLVFVLGPFLGIVGVIIGFFAAGVGITVGGIGGILGVFLEPIFPNYISLGGISSSVLIFFFIGMSALGLLFLIGVWYVTKWFYLIGLKYLKWNIRIITGKDE